MQQEDEYFMERMVKESIAKRRKTYKGTDEEFDKKLDEKLPELLNSIVRSTAEEISKYCLSNKSDHKKQSKKIQKSVSSKYRLGLSLFEAFIELNSKISSNTYAKYYKVFDNLDDHLKLDTLIGLHVRGCQIASEIKVLINFGFADGAMARWRSLHELCITFLLLYDSDYETIRMFNDYEIIESWKKAQEYQQNCHHFGEEPFSPKKLSQLKEERKLLIQKYGKDFSKSYGWTIKILPNGRRNIREIEKKVGEDYLRSAYTWAGENVHAGISGNVKKLGLRDEESQHFLTGPNDYGFLDPVKFTSYSLAEMSHTLLNMESSIMNGIYESILEYFQRELVDEFAKQQNKYA